uniref:ADP-ribosyl cyclase/cyclic ADP-ribose hydrolase n=2 Tax=Solanum chacoense TaxID=4108 RepID=A0A0V0HVJ6_SOLCH
MEQAKFSYHVFLSFKAHDTGKTFTDHLHTNLFRAGFHVFKCEDDDEEEDKIDELKLKLKKGIEQSRMSVIVLSQNYASSERCLYELVVILEQRRNSGHIVLPVFFNVDPSDVRKQKGSFGKENFQIVNGESHKLRDWRNALKEVADLGGMPLQNQADG